MSPPGATREVIELEDGITVYPPRREGGRWRAVWHEDGERQQCESVSQEQFAAKLEKVRQRLAAGASNMTRPGADLIAWYLNPDRLPVKKRWSRKHADTQRRLCQRYAAPFIGVVTCQDITAVHAQKIVNAAPAASEGGRVHRMLSALVGAGIKGLLPSQPGAGRGPLAGREPAVAWPKGHGGGGVGAAGGSRRDPVQRYLGVVADLAREATVPRLKGACACSVTLTWPGRPRLPGEWRGGALAVNVVIRAVPLAVSQSG